MSKNGGQAKRNATAFLDECRILRFQFNPESNRYLAEVGHTRPENIPLVDGRYLDLQTVAERFFKGNMDSAKKLASDYQNNKGFGLSFD